MRVIASTPSVARLPSFQSEKSAPLGQPNSDNCSLSVSFHALASPTKARKAGPRSSSKLVIRLIYVSSWTKGNQGKAFRRPKVRRRSFTPKPLKALQLPITTGFEPVPDA